MAWLRILSSLQQWRAWRFQQFGNLSAFPAAMCLRALATSVNSPPAATTASSGKLTAATASKMLFTVLVASSRQPTLNHAVGSVPTTDTTTVIVLIALLTNPLYSLDAVINCTPAFLSTSSGHAAHTVGMTSGVERKQKNVASFLHSTKSASSALSSTLHGQHKGAILLLNELAAYAFLLAQLPGQRRSHFNRSRSATSSSSCASPCGFHTTENLCSEKMQQSLSSFRCTWSRLCKNRCEKSTNRCSSTLKMLRNSIVACDRQTSALQHFPPVFPSGQQIFAQDRGISRNFFMPVSCAVSTVVFARKMTQLLAKTLSSISYSGVSLRVHAGNLTKSRDLSSLRANSLYAGTADDDETISGAAPDAGERYLLPAAEDEEDEEERLELKESTPASSLKTKNDFETVVSDEMLQDMVRQGYIYDEEEEENEHQQKSAPYILDGLQFRGCSPFASPPYGTMKRMVAYSRDMSSALTAGNEPAQKGEEKQPISPLEKEEPFANFYRTLANHTKNIDFYVEPGCRLEKVSEGVLVTPPIFPNRVFYWKEDDLANKVFENPYHDSFVKSQEPSYLLPTSPALRTGRRRDLHRRTDTGKHQRRRWRMDECENDIPRGNWTYSNDIYKEMLDSIDWEREWPHPQDMNYYKRSHVSTLLGDNDRNEDSYWDPQYIGGVDTYPRVVLAGMNFTWNVFWVPWLCKKFPRKGGYPLKSELFNLGGIEPLQIWFYPDGCETSHPGFCAVKVVSRPGWNLPYKLNIWIKGSTVAVPYRQSKAPVSRTIFSQQKNQYLTTEIGSHSLPTAEVENPKHFNEKQSTQPYRVFRSCVHLGPINREEADYVAYSYSFCRLLDKRSFLRVANAPFPAFGSQEAQRPLYFNEETDVVLGAAGDIEIGVGVADEDWEWDDGHCSMEQWLKLQSANPDDLELEETLPAGFTNSDMFENYKYRDVPDKHFAKYLPSMLPPALEGDEFKQAALNRRHAY